MSTYTFFLLPGSADRFREDISAGGRSIQDQAPPRGAGHREAEGGAPSKDRDGLRYGRDPEGGGARIQGDADLPQLQGQA